jgi:hypothetical protein
VTLLREVVATLVNEGIPHALIGAAAMALHGVSRSTADVDLLTVDSRALRRDCWAAFERRGLEVRILRGDAEDPLAGSVRIGDGQQFVDVVVGRQAWEREQVEAAVRRSLGDFDLPVVEPAGIVLLKLHAGGPKDAWDIRSVLEVARDREALLADVERTIGRLPQDARRLWARIREET